MEIKTRIVIIGLFTGFLISFICGNVVGYKKAVNYKNIEKTQLLEVINTYNVESENSKIYIDCQENIIRDMKAFNVILKQENGVLRKELIKVNKRIDSLEVMTYNKKEGVYLPPPFPFPLPFPLQAIW